MCSRIVLNMRSFLLVQTECSTVTGEIELTHVSVIEFAQRTQSRSGKDTEGDDSTV